MDDIPLLLDDEEKIMWQQAVVGVHGGMVRSLLRRVSIARQETERVRTERDEWKLKAAQGEAHQTRLLKRLHEGDPES